MFVEDNSKRRPPNDERFLRNSLRFTIKIGILEMIGNFNLQFLQKKNPSLISDVLSKISSDKSPLHFTQNMKWAIFSFNEDE